MKCFFITIICLSFLSNIHAQQLVVYPAPAKAERSMHNDDFTVRVRKPGGKWQDLFEYYVKVDQVKGTDHHVENASMCSFDFSGDQSSPERTT